MLGIALIAFGEEIGANPSDMNPVAAVFIFQPPALAQPGAEMACRSIDHILQYGELTLRLQ